MKLDSDPNPQGRLDREPGIAGLHSSPLLIARNWFVGKSLSSWSLNPVLGCSHGCSFCYVPDSSAGKQARILGGYGVTDPNTEWGNYTIVRPFDETAFMKSLHAAETTPTELVNADGNRAVMLSTTTDPYQVIRDPDMEKSRRLSSLLRANVRRALELIRDHSTLNVRILTRSPLAKNDFDIFKSLGNRLLLGTSLPTLDGAITAVYEPYAPHPKKRLKLLLDAHAEGIPTYVAVAPVFPEVGREGMLEVFRAAKEADPVTIFMEPINIRDGIAKRIDRKAQAAGRSIDVELFINRERWGDYAVRQLRDAESAAAEAGVADRLHLWPDHTDMKTDALVLRQENPREYMEWLSRWWNRVSEWPGKPL